jgi:heme oxygenase
LIRYFEEAMDQDAAKNDFQSRGQEVALLPRASLAQEPLPASPLDTVRRATADSHRLLESMPAQARLMCDDFTFAEYRSTLQRLYGFYEPLARTLVAEVHTEHWGLRIAARAELIASDLVELGLLTAGLREIARCKRLPAFHSADRALGCAYVLEGATLGGRVIFKQLARVLGRRGRFPARFFAGDGERTSVHWRRFCATLNADTADVDEMCSGAADAFDAMAAWLAEPAPVA